MSLPASAAMDHDRALGLDYRAWKGHLSSYEYCSEHAADYSSLTAQWLPGCHPSAGHPGYQDAALLLGTQTGGEEPNHVYLARLRLPSSLPVLRDEIGPAVDWERVGAVPVPGDVNRARCMPQRPSLAAVHTSQPGLLLVDWEHAQLRPNPWFRGAAHQGGGGGGGGAAPQAAAICCALDGHSSEGFGLSWHPHAAGQLLSGATDGRVCLWDLGGGPRQLAGALQPLACHQHPGGGGVNDVAWCQHEQQQRRLAVACEDGQLLLLDARLLGGGGAPCTSAAAAAAAAPAGPQQQLAEVGRYCHGCALNCVAFDPLGEHRLALGTGRRQLLLMDARRLDRPLATLRSHRAPVLQVGRRACCWGASAAAAAVRQLPRLPSGAPICLHPGSSPPSPPSSPSHPAAGLAPQGARPAGLLRRRRPGAVVGPARRARPGCGGARCAASSSRRARRAACQGAADGLTGAGAAAGADLRARGQPGPG
jgi:histone-binding protein RBBP4